MPVGAVLLDLKQKTLTGIAQQVVEQMVITDQIKVEDRANVLRALLLKHRSFIHPLIILHPSFSHPSFQHHTFIPTHPPSIIYQPSIDCPCILIILIY